MFIKKVIPILSVIMLLSAFSSCGKPTQNPGITETPIPNETTTAEPKTEPEREPDRSAEYIYEMNPELTPVDYASPALLPESDPMDENYLRETVFLCDSPLYWLGPKGFVEMEQIWTGPEGTQTLAYQSDYEILDRYDNVERPIREVVRRHKPKRLIVTMGINGLSFMSEEEYRREYLDLVTDIQEISPETDLILQSVLPMSPAMFQWSSADVDNVKITKANSIILQIAEETGCKYLDTFSVFIGEDGYGKDELLRDGLHPNDEGLQLVLNYINTHGHTEQ